MSKKSYWFPSLSLEACCEMSGWVMALSKLYPSVSISYRSQDGACVTCFYCSMSDWRLSVWKSNSSLSSFWSKYPGGDQSLAWGPNVVNRLILCTLWPFPLKCVIYGLSAPSKKYDYDYPSISLLSSPLYLWHCAVDGVHPGQVFGPLQDQNSTVSLHAHSHKA